MSTIATRATLPLFARWTLACLALALTFTLGFADDAKPNGQATFDEIAVRMAKVQGEFMEKLQAEEDRSKQREMYENRPGLEFAAEFKALAVANKSTEVAAQCWMQVAEISGDFDKPQDFKTAVDTLITEHIASKHIARLPAMLGGMGWTLGEEKVEPMLENLLAKSTHKPVQAGAIFELAQLALRSEDKARHAKARPYFERLSKEFGDLKSAYDKDYKTIVAGFLFELDNLQIGQTPPDFEVTDENGVKFKLSDYRGKVVVLDFWGFW